MIYYIIYGQTVQKPGNNGHLNTCSGLQSAKQFESQEYIVGVIITEVVDF